MTLSRCIFWQGWTGQLTWLLGDILKRNSWHDIITDDDVWVYSVGDKKLIMMNVVNVYQGHVCIL